MSEDPLFNLETDPLVLDEELNSEPSVQPPPVVMIQYRNRGIPPVLLFPSTLILSLGMFAAYHYLFVAPRQRELQEQARAQAASLAAASKPEATEVKAPEQPPTGLSLDSQPLPPGFQIPPPTIVKDADATRVVAKPVGDPESDPSIWDEVNGESEKPAVVKSDVPAAATTTPVAEPRKEAAPPAIGLVGPSEPPKIEPPKELALGPASTAPTDVVEPDVVKPAAVPVEAPTPTPEEMQRALEAEADAKRIEREEQLRLKDQARAQVENEAQERVENERTQFREELKRIVAAGGAGAGQEIDDLCNTYGRTYSSDVKSQVLSCLSRYHGKVSRDAEIRMLRSIGVPEPGILDYLANNVNRSMNSRNGPRDPDAVRVLAARQLLRTKVLSNPAMGTGAPTSPARVRQSPAVRGAAAGPGR